MGHRDKLQSAGGGVMNCLVSRETLAFLLDDSIEVYNGLYNAWHVAGTDTSDNPVLKRQQRIIDEVRAILEGSA